MVISPLESISCIRFEIILSILILLGAPVSAWRKLDNLNCSYQSLSWVPICQSSNDLSSLRATDEVEAHFVVLQLTAITDHRSGNIWMQHFKLQLKL